MNKKTIGVVNDVLYSYVKRSLYFKKDYGSYVKEIFKDYQSFCIKAGVTPLAYREFRESLKDILMKREPEALLTKRNSRFFILNIIRGLELQC